MQPALYLVSSHPVCWRIGNASTSGRLSEARIILLSGADATWLRMAGELGSLHGLKVTGVLAKPFRVADLRRLLAEAAAG